ncbi:N-alpha-acetyltransferase 38, NatC auxiliary subunit-like [Artemia franciscana]|uniref:N-alpha-acetyltransferase 38, NatC auxiliary subunit-like n=1 Tax=Artemia franciscana TaxID=6661 RepID=UPI0032D9C29A
MEKPREYIRSLLNKSMLIQTTDGRTFIGSFLCTDKESNVILGSCMEYRPGDENLDEEPRSLGLAMVPGKHIVKMMSDDISKIGMQVTYLEDYT